MHTTSGPGGTTFHHNGDFSGNVKVIVNRSDVHPTHSDYLVEVEIPFEDLMTLVAQYARMHLVRRLEDADSHQVLGLRPW